MAENLTRQILKEHMVDGELKPGSPISLKMDQALLQDATTSDDAERSKPDPDIIAAALKKSGSSPGRAIMIGDTPYDVEAAGRAGVAVVALRCGGWDDRALHGSIAIYDHPQALLDRVHDSPFVIPR